MMITMLKANQGMVWAVKKFCCKVCLSGVQRSYERKERGVYRYFGGTVRIYNTINFRVRFCVMTVLKYLACNGECGGQLQMKWFRKFQKKFRTAMCMKRKKGKGFWSNESQMIQTLLKYVNVKAELVVL